MGKYDEAGKQAASATDKLLAEDINGLNLGKDKITSLFPEAADQVLVKELIEKINKSTSRNDAVSAYKAFTLKATAKAVEVFNGTFKVAKKLVL